MESSPKWSPKNQKINELPFPPKVLLPPVHQKSVLKFKAEVWLTDLFSTFEMSKTVWVECSSCLDWELESHVSMKCEYRQLQGTGRYWRKPYFPVKNGKSNHHCACEVKVAQLCPTLCDLMDCIVHGILQARILEWVAFPFSRVSSQPRDQTQVSRTAGRFFTSWATREAETLLKHQKKSLEIKGQKVWRPSWNSGRNSGKNAFSRLAWWFSG